MRWRPQRASGSRPDGVAPSNEKRADACSRGDVDGDRLPDSSHPVAQFGGLSERRAAMMAGSNAQPNLTALGPFPSTDTVAAKRHWPVASSTGSGNRHGITHPGACCDGAVQQALRVSWIAADWRSSKRLVAAGCGYLWCATDRVARVQS